MKRNEWITALGTGPREKRSFSSEKLDIRTGRSDARRVEPPVIEHVEITYDRWDGPRGDWSDSMGKFSACVKPLDGGEPERSCNEVEVAKLLRTTLGYEAFFFTTYGIPEPWQPWVRPDADAPGWLRQLDEDIHNHPYGPRRGGGMPDVVAWHPDARRPLDTAVFVECKGPVEKVLDNQEPWVAAAIALGVPPEAFAVAVRMSR